MLTRGKSKLIDTVKGVQKEEWSMIMIVVLLCHLSPSCSSSKKYQILKMINKYLRKTGLIRKTMKKGILQKICNVLLSISGMKIGDGATIISSGNDDIYFDLLNDEMALLLGLNCPDEEEEATLETLMDNFKQLMYFIFKNQILLRKSIGENVYKLLAIYPALIV